MNAEAGAGAVDPFAPFADAQRWVAWQIIRRGKKDTKLPLGAGGKAAKADQPATWLLRPAAESLARSRSLPGIGIMLGKLGDTTVLGGLDLDSCRDAAGAPHPWAQAILNTLPTYAEVSPSGNGIKLVFQIAAHNARALLQRIGIEAGKYGCKRSIDASGADHGPAVELYLSHRFFTVTFDRWTESPPEIALIDWATLERLSHLIPRPADPKGGGKGPGGDTSRSAKAFKIVAELRRKNPDATRDDMLAALRADPDTAAWLREKGEAAGGRELERLWQKTEPPAPDLSDEEMQAEIARLARLSLLKYAQQRSASAKRLRITVAILNRLVALQRGDAAHNGQGQAVKFAAIEPWPEPVDGIELLEALARYFTDHLVLPPGAADVMALWAVHTHAFTLFNFTPRLQFKAATKGAGKSTAIELLKGVVARPIETETVSQAFLFRVISLAQPTLLLDEADTYLRDDQDLRGLVNAGVKAGAMAGRCVGEAQEPRLFPCHAPIALAGIGALPGTIEDRAIQIHMKRRLRSEAIAPIEDATRTHAGELARQAARWIQDHDTDLHVHRPDMGGLINRAADRWRSLYAIADLAGGGWPDKVRKAQAEVAADDTDAEGLGERALADIRDAFDAWVAEHPGAIRHEMESAELVRRLVALEGGRWAEMGRARRPLTTNALARLLRPFDVQPEMIGPENYRRKGYRLLDFRDAFARHLGGKG